VSPHFPCKPLQNRSGETRNGTGDTMIFSDVLCVRQCSQVFRISCKFVESPRGLFVVVHRCSWRVGVPVGVQHTARSCSPCVDVIKLVNALMASLQDTALGPYADPRNAARPLHPFANLL